MTLIDLLDLMITILFIILLGFTAVGIGFAITSAWRRWHGTQCFCDRITIPRNTGFYDLAGTRHTHDACWPVSETVTPVNFRDHWGDL